MPMSYSMARELPGQEWTLEQVPFTPGALVGSVRKEKFHVPEPGCEMTPASELLAALKNPPENKHKTQDIRT